MKRFILAIGIIAVAAAFIAAGAESWRRYAPHSALQTAGYEVVRGEVAPPPAMPSLPDLSLDTVDDVRAALPPMADGPVRVAKIDTLYLGLARDLHLFSAMQKRFDPLAIVIGGGVHTLESVSVAVNDPTLIKREENGDYALFVPVLVEKNAALIIRDGEKLYMAADHGALIITFGRVDVVGAQIKGWNFTRNGLAQFNADREFRPYITALCGSTMNVAGSDIANLGYFDTKAYGLSYSSCDDIAYEDKGANRVGGTGRVIGNRFDGLYYGFYTYESDGVRVVRNEFTNSIVYGIDPHDRSKGLVVAHNVIRGTRQKHGIIFSRDVQDSFIIGNISEDNKRAGLIMDRNSSRNVITQNILRRNGGDGMAFYESGDNLSYGNIMAYNAGSGLRIRNSRNVVSRDDVISHNKAGGVMAYTIDLLAAGAVRNIKKDPYEQAVSTVIAGTEMVGNNKADVTIRGVDDITLSSLKRFQSPVRLMAGDVSLKDMPGDTISLRRAAP